MAEPSTKFSYNRASRTELMPVRPTRWQELIRQAILILPLTTAIVGTLLIRLMPDTVDYYTSLLPAIFLVGALVVTAAMIHQRRLFKTAFDLGELLYSANTQLDILHRLAFELNQSRSPEAAALTILEHAVKSVHADVGAIWLLVENTNLEGAKEEPRHGALNENWMRLAVTGFNEDLPLDMLDKWEQLVQVQHQFMSCEEGSHYYNVQGAESLCPALAASLPPNASAAVLPIIWKDEIVGCILVVSRAHMLTRDDLTLLSDMTLVAGPSLQNAIAYQSLSERAEIDGLTRLYNHRALQERLAQEVARTKRLLKTNSNAKFAVAAMDITDFKLFNDTYGHATGDAVLRTVSDCLRQTVRTSDVVGRYGGDEFVMLLPDTDMQGATVISRRAIEAVAARQFHAPDGSRISIKLSCGVAVLPDDGHTSADVLKVSDARLYIAKGKGKMAVEADIAALQSATTKHKPDWNIVGVLEALVSAIDNKDRFTRSHCERVWHYATQVAQEMQLAADQVQALQISSLVHDVGKIIVPDSILRKPGRLNDEELSVMQQHPVFGAMLVKDVPHLENVLNGVRYHHEWYDGSGYPNKLSGQDIPLIARIIAVVDGYVALISDRPYRKAMAPADALAEIVKGANSQFDPVIVEALTRVHRKIQAENLAMLNGSASEPTPHPEAIEASAPVATTVVTTPQS